jgi:SAM-dependent methyltransferase
MAEYVFEQAWAQERLRLDALGRMYDPGSFAVLAERGIADGWRCLEVGGGSGTIARWMKQQVGARGTVVATDLDPRFLEPLVAEGVDVRRHDIVSDPLEEGAFDLVHARAVLQHIPRRDEALARMIRALRPGGWLVIEDIVSPSPLCHPDLPVWAKILGAVDAGLRKAGADPDLGMRLHAMFTSAGLREVGCRARVEMLHSGTPSIDFVRLSIEHIGDRLVAAGAITADELAEALTALRNPGYTTAAATMIATWGAAA